MELVNLTDSKIAIQGYDPVSYFTSTPTQGDPTITAAHVGGIFQFSNPENQKTFETDPELYLPQYGGFCAIGVCEGKQVDIDPQTFAIDDNKLYLFCDANNKAKWDKDQATCIKKADKQWNKGELISG